MVQFNDNVKVRIVPREERMAQFRVWNNNKININQVHYKIANIINQSSYHKIFIIPDDEPLRIINPELNWSYDTSPLEIYHKLQDKSYRYYFINEFNKVVEKNIKQQSIGNITYRFDKYMIRIYQVMN